MEIEPLPELNRRVWLLAMVAELIAMGCRDESSTTWGIDLDAPRFIRTFDDLAALINRVLDRDFNIAGAERRLGKIDRWVGERAEVKSIDPALKQVVIETFRGSPNVVKVTLTSPLLVDWRDLKQSLGEPERGALTPDDRGGPIPYQFQRKGLQSRGIVLLYITDYTQSMAHIHEVVVRRDWPTLGNANEASPAHP